MLSLNKNLMAKFTIFDGCYPTKIKMTPTFCQHVSQTLKLMGHHLKSRVSFLPLNVAATQQIAAHRNIKTN
jgi:hypothetical protein